MHDSFVDIKMEQHYGLHHEDDFGGQGMVGVAGDHSQHQSPSNEYGGFAFATSAHAHVESMYDRSVQPSFSSPQPLHPLATMPQWPSQITNPSESSPPAPMPLHRPILPMSKTSPILKIAPATTPAPMKPAHSTSTSRKTLSDTDRRRMCEYHNENPNVKQTEIGSKWDKILLNVEIHC